MSKKINIRPTTSVYATYRNINYETWNAIAEFIDNSTQSYYDNKKRLETTKYWKHCEVNVIYEKDENGYYLEIRDNAFGMDFNDFKRAIILDSKPSKATRNEFGMGLKTAACWFGKKWSVESTQLGSDVKYKTEVDVELLSKYKNEEIEVSEERCSEKEHGTIIRIWDLNRSVQGRTVKKTKDMLRGMYRVDLRSGNIKIFYNEEELVFNDPEIFTEQLPDGSEKKWEQEIKFELEHDDRIFHVTGMIAIRKVASTSEAGFTLLKNGRVIIGGYENNYRPSDIFGKQNSFEYQRLFGELSLDDWPVVQTKDNFDWKNGLEDLFIDKLKETTIDYVKKARTIRKRKTVDHNKMLRNMVDDYEKAGVINEPIVNDVPSEEIASTQKSDINNIDKEFGVEGDNQVALENDANKMIKFNVDDVEYKFEMIIIDDDPSAEWLSIVKNEEAESYTIKWNISNVFFKELSDNPKFISKMQSFIFGLSLAEILSRRYGENGLINPGDIRRRMNKILKDLGGD